MGAGESGLPLTFEARPQRMWVGTASWQRAPGRGHSRLYCFVLGKGVLGGHSGWGSHML